MLLQHIVLTILKNSEIQIAFGRLVAVYHFLYSNHPEDNNADDFITHLKDLSLIKQYIGIILQDQTDISDIQLLSNQKSDCVEEFFQDLALIWENIPKELRFTSEELQRGSSCIRALDCMYYISCTFSKYVTLTCLLLPCFPLNIDVSLLPPQ